MFGRISRWLLGATAAGAVASGVYLASPQPETVWLVTGLGTYVGTAPFTQTKSELEALGYRVSIKRHNEGDDFTSLPDVLVGHSMGGNAVLKATQRFIDVCNVKNKSVPDRVACYEKTLPRLVVSIDAGRYPLYSFAPSAATVRCVSLYDPLHPIGGQKVYPNRRTGRECENYRIRGTVHIGMPAYEKVVKVVTRTIQEGKKND